MIVRIVNGIEKFSRLGQEGSDLTIVPTREDGLAIGHEFDRVAFKAWYLDSEELLSGLGIPYTDVIN